MTETRLRTTYYNVFTLLLKKNTKKVIENEIKGKRIDPSNIKILLVEFVITFILNFIGIHRVNLSLSCLSNIWNTHLLFGTLMSRFV